MPYAYAWSNAATTASITGIIADSFAVVITDANGCIDSSQVTITASSIFESSALDKIKLYPNPSRDIFNLSFFNSVRQDIDISVYSLLGEKVYKEFIKDHFGNFETSFNLEIFGKSMYLLEIKTNNIIINEKIILE